MKSKNTLNIGLLICLLLFTGSCVKENSPKTENPVNPMLSIKVTVPESKTVSSRALGETLEAVQDLNVIIYFDDMNPEIFYFDTSDPRLPLAAGSSGATFEILDLDVVLIDQISVYLMANYGEPLSASNIATPDALKETKLTLPENNVPEECVMFAYAGTKILADDVDDNRTVSLSAQLVRTLAKVTLDIKGTNTLEDGLRITPTAFRIMNVPNEMWLVEDPSAERINKASDENIIRDGYEMPLTIGFVTKDKTIGSHDSSIALYLFENKQGKDENAEQIKKEPTGEFKNASYIEVDAQYYYSQNGGQDQIAGIITYRFCLGTDETSNYDVIRNHHYRVTLQLDNWGGAKEAGALADGVLVVGNGDGVNWRVDIDLADWGFTGNSNIGGGAYYGSFPIPIGKSQVKITSVTYSTGWNHWMGIQKNSSSGVWEDIEDAGSGSNTVEDTFNFYVKPWRNPTDYPASGELQYRDIEVDLEATDNSESNPFLIRQWTPILIYTDSDPEKILYMERFEDPDMLLAPWSSGTTPNLSVGDEVGWNNTWELRNSSPAAQVALRKAGIYWGAIASIGVAEIPNNSYGNMRPFINNNAAFYLPSKDELEIMLLFDGDITNPYNTYVPVEWNADYWTSTVNEDGGVCYWDGTDHEFKYTSAPDDLTILKRVRAVYRPSLDDDIDAISGLPLK